MGANKNERVGVILAALIAVGCAADEAADADLAAGARIAEQAIVRPIVVVAGMMEDRETMAPLSEVLRARGFDVTVWVPANLGLDSINGYAQQLGETVEEVQRRTGAQAVDLVCHSQGGVTARRYAQLAGGDAPVHTLVSLGSPQQGTEVGALGDTLIAAGLFNWAEGAKQLAAGSAFLTELNTKGDPTPGETRYVAIGTQLDTVTKPVARSAIPGGENVVMQVACPGRNVGHFGLLSDAWVHQLVFSVLAGGPARADCAARPLGSAT